VSAKRSVVPLHNGETCVVSDDSRERGHTMEAIDGGVSAKL
jgi:hypothetical protein